MKKRKNLKNILILYYNKIYNNQNYFEEMLKNGEIKKQNYNRLKKINNEEMKKIRKIIKKIKYKYIYKNIDFYDIIKEAKNDSLLKIAMNEKMLKLYKINDTNNYIITKYKIKNILKNLKIINYYIGLYQKNDTVDKRRLFARTKKNKK